MEKLKQNAFAVGLSTAGVVALVLLWFLVLGPLFGSGTGSRGEVTDRLTQTLATYKKLADKKKTPTIPTEKNNKAKELDAEKIKAAVTAGTNFYETHRDRFHEMHPDASPDDPAQFKGWYETAVGKLHGDYRKKFFPEASAPTTDGTAAADATAAAPAAAPAPAAKDKDAAQVEEPEIQEAKITSVEEIKRTMKEYWVTEDIFRVATELEAGGLHWIRFPGRSGDRAGRGDKDKESDGPKDHTWMKASVSIDLPLIKVEPFLAKLLQSDKILYRVDTIETVRPPNSHAAKLVVVSKDGENRVGDSEEPPVTAAIVLSAMEWVGAPPPTEKEEKKEPK